jgi:pimeloyl-ACP methyl ester carboxylesterase
VREQAKTLKTGLAELCPHWTVAGMSMGGWVAAWLALDWKEGVDRLLLAGSAGLKKYRDEQVAKTFLDPTVDKLKDFDDRAYFHKRKFSDRVWNDVLDKMKSKGVVAQILQAQTEQDFLDEKLRSLHVPTMIFWGREDRVIPPVFGKMMHEMIPASIYREVPECGHVPQSDCPGAFFKAIRELLNYGFM